MVNKCEERVLEGVFGGSADELSLVVVTARVGVRLCLCSISFGGRWVFRIWGVSGGSRGFIYLFLASD